MKFNRNAVGCWCAAIIAAVLTQIAIRRCANLHPESNLVDSLAAAERQLNSSAPKMLDAETRLDGGKAGPGKRFTYIYTITPFKAAEIDAAAWESKIRPGIRKKMKNAGMGPMFQQGVTVVYRYLGNDGGTIDEIVMTPEEGNETRE